MVPLQPAATFSALSAYNKEIDVEYVDHKALPAVTVIANTHFGANRDSALSDRNGVQLT